MANPKKAASKKVSRGGKWPGGTRPLKSRGTVRKRLPLPEAFKIISRSTALPEAFFHDLLAAGKLSPGTQELFAAVVKLQAQGTVAPKRVTGITLGLAQVVREFGATADDPLAAVDDANQESIARSVAKSQHNTQLRRERILQDCISSGEAAELVDRVRQNIERRRRERGLVALRVKNQWQYPRWQFDPDKPGGVLEGLGEVLAHLDMSEIGKILWLTEPNERLGGRSAVDLLRKGEARSVIELAKESSYLP